MIKDVFKPILAELARHKGEFVLKNCGEIRKPGVENPLTTPRLYDCCPLTVLCFDRGVNSMNFDGLTHCEVLDLDVEDRGDFIIAADQSNYNDANIMELRKTLLETLGLSDERSEDV